MTQPTRSARVSPQALPASDDAGAISAQCFRLAGQLAGGPVRDALLAMGRDYAARARATAQTAGFRFELAASQRAAPAKPLAQLFDALSQWLAPIAPPAARSAETGVPAATRSARTPGVARTPRAAAPTAAPAAKPARGSRLFRAHALGRFGS
jgi:hypothetical protein